MSTTYNHFQTGAIVAALVGDASLTTKATVGVALVIGHFAADLLPHKHAHDLSKWRESWSCKSGILVDAVFSFSIYLWAVMHTAQPELVTLFCTAANLVDLDVFIRKDPIHRWHKAAHAWWQQLRLRPLMFWEAVQTTLLLAVYVTLY